LGQALAGRSRLNSFVGWSMLKTIVFDFGNVTHLFI